MFVMKKLLIRLLPAIFIPVALLTADAPFETEFTSTPLMEREATMVVQLLEHAHFSKRSISDLDLEDLLTRYMAELDHARLFYTREDQRQIVERFVPELEFGIFQGNLDPAMKIFSRYKARALDRLEWVLSRLEEDFDLNTDLEYQFDRREADWPRDDTEAEQLWEKRIKHEVLQMVLDDEPVRAVLKRIEGHYEEAAAAGKAIETDSLAELFQENDQEALLTLLLERLESEDRNLSDLEADELTVLVRAKARNLEMERALERIERRYQRMKQSIGDIDAVEIQELYLTTLTKMFDPHSTFLSANTLEDFSINMRLSLVGIGAVLSSEDGYCVIRELVPGGPADLTNRLQPEDRIVAVKQENEEPVDVVDMKLRRIVNMIRGEKGTEVTLTVIPANATDPSAREEVTIVRDEVKLTARQARGRIYDFPLESGNTRSLGVIEIPSFYGSAETNTSTTEDVKELIGKMKEEGIDGLVLDLRRNGGGLLSEAINLTGLFIDAGPVVMKQDSFGNVQSDPVPRNGRVYDGSLGILVSKNSASASEIVAGALQAYERAIVVGESSTHGKGTVQAVYELGNYLGLPRTASTGTGATKMTVQKFYLPDGASTQNRGMIPDVVIPSFNDFLPIGESSLPNALAWDTLTAPNWERDKRRAGVVFPITDERREQIVEMSRERQSSLYEFVYWNENIDWFQQRQDRKSVSLNLEARRSQRESDRAFRDAMNEREDELARTHSLTYAEILLESADNGNPAYPPDPDLPDPRDLDSPDEENGNRERLDIHLRETLRVLSDLIDLEQEHRDAVAAAR